MVTYFKKHRFWILPALLLPICYIPILREYAYTDSYEFLWSASRNDTFIDVFIQGGRPLFGMFNQWLFSSGEVGNMIWVRLLSLVGSIFFVGYLGKIIQQKFENELVTWLVLAVFSLCSYMCVAVCWEAAWQMGWASWMALVSFSWASKGLQTTSANRWLYITGAIAMGCASLMFYQPSFSFFMAAVLLEFVRARNTENTLKHIGLYLVTMGLYFLSFKTMLWATGLPALERSGLTTDIIGKIVWFVQVAWFKSFEISLSTLKNGYINMLRIPMLCFLLFGVWMFVSVGKSVKEKGIGLALWLACYLLAYLPSLASSENFASNRGMGALVLINILFVFYFLSMHVNQRVSRWLSIAVACIGTVFGIINIHQFTYYQALEYTAVSKKVEKTLERMPESKTLHVVRPSANFMKDKGLVGQSSSGELGIFSNSISWTTHPLMVLLVEKHAPKFGINPQEMKIVVCSDDDKSACEGKAPLINIGNVLEKTLER